ncbi:hypothetical protein JOS77_29040 [Chromobacterium haemolyticum]|nr:hypothetical protein JOS77_29040 [Chromobacterium haemolyticum]
MKYFRGFPHIQQEHGVGVFAAFSDVCADVAPHSVVSALLNKALDVMPAQGAGHGLVHTLLPAASCANALFR